ncbi:Uncharacterized protein dnm_027950 [Desulfonema magnum]|uniref:Uncharacterized protein n=1 Tax=Desulfonema magnum TaxID=45655 RepID=A0A975GMC7_9BACT|nr:Uncharacterized protein dnm_027950 [Desulfonema magnum]
MLELMLFLCKSPVVCKTAADRKFPSQGKSGSDVSDFSIC